MPNNIKEVLMGTKRLRSSVIYMAAVMVLLMLAPATSLFAQRQTVQTDDFSDIPVEGRGQQGTRFVGTLDITGFVQQGNQAVAEGVLSGTVYDRQGNVVGEVVDKPLLASEGNAIPLRTLKISESGNPVQILELFLGPLDLDLLGLRIQLDPIYLLITADPAGGILGQILAALGGPVGGSGQLGAIVGLLNEILAILEGLV
jgi:hypothetical protein